MIGIVGFLFPSGTSSSWKQWFGAQGRSLDRDETMLVLSRKVGERILIGDNISVTVVRVAQGTVRIGVEAPEDLPIVREEIKGQRKETSPVDRKVASGAGSSVKNPR
jgi:carbon storage regulator